MTHTNANLAAVIARTRHLFFDFDGPICGIFAGHPAPTIAGELRDLIRRLGAPITAAIDTADDPLLVLRLIAQHGDETVTRRVADALRDAEVTATESAEPTPHLLDVVAAARDTSRRLAIVSNNSVEAVTTYLHRHDLHQSFTAILGRYGDMNPGLLKPDRHLLGLAMYAIDAPPWSSALVGDSRSDIDAARSVPIASIGYAPDPDRAASLAAAGADAVVATMAELAATIRSQPL